MRALIICAGIAVAAGLSGCGTLSGVTGGATRSAEQREQDRATLELLLQHCDLTANFDMEIGLSPRSGAEVKAGGTCRASQTPAAKPAGPAQ